MENYRDIPGYEGKYAVSNLGNVKILKTGKILRCGLTRNYLNVSLFANSARKVFGVHQLVAITFLNHKPDGTHKIVVDHINGDKLDNRLENLQLITQRENITKSKPKRDLPTCVYKVGNKFRVRANINGVFKSIGTFNTIEEASAAYQEAISKL
jgi:hypothetical protein